MDPLTLTVLATQVVAILTSLFGEVGEAIATKFGEDTYQASKYLYEVVRDRLAKKDDGGMASRTLQNFADDPQVYDNVFKEMLLPLLHIDPNFADTLNVILHSGPIQRITVRADARVEDTQMSNKLGQGTQTIEGGDRSTFSDVSMNIGPKREEQESGDKATRKEISLPQPQLRDLHARLPKRVRVGDRVPLQVRVALSPALNRSTTLRPFSIPPQGADVKLVLDCPGFLLHSASMATVHVVPSVDSDWALFELEALHEGVHVLEVSAFNGGAFLGTLSVQLTVDSLAGAGQSVDRVTPVSLSSPQEGEVTLVIHYDPFGTVYRYQFRSTTFGETDELRSGPLRRKQEEAVADLIALLNEQARDLTGYSAEETRSWLQGKGTELWNELIPKELENLFWQQRDNIKWMTILSAGDPMPWEVMYPTNDAGDEAGFLAEQFPIVRWMFGPSPATRLQCSQPFFVIPEDAPPTAEDELAALRRVIRVSLQ